MPQLVFAKQFSRNARHPRWSGERLINAHLVAFPDDAPAGALIQGFYGLSTFVSTGQTLPVRAMHRVREKVYAIAGGKLHEISASGARVERASGITDDWHTTLASNDAGDLAIQAGTDFFVYDYSAGSLVTPTLPSIAAPQFVAALNQRFVVAEKDGDRYQIGGLNDGTSWTSLFSTADSSSDNLIAVVEFLGALYLMGRQTIEIHQPYSATNEPFKRVAGGVFPFGVFNPHSIAVDRGYAFFISNTRRVMMSTGGVPVDITTDAVSDVLNDYDEDAVISGLIMSEGRNLFYVLRFQDRPALVFHIQRSAWTERMSGLSEEDPWLGTCALHAYGEQLVGGSDGVIYRANSAAFKDGSKQLARIGVSATIQNELERFKLKRVGFDVFGGYTDIGREAQFSLSVSRNGAPFGLEKFRAIGRVAENSRLVTFRNLGQYRRCQLKFRYTDPTPFALGGSNYRAT